MRKVLFKTKEKQRCLENYFFNFKIKQLFKHFKRRGYVMKTATYQIDVNDILDRIFTFFAKRGLENVTIRELCRGTGLVQGTIYYWFGDKTKMICECTEYGLKKVTDEIFRYVFSSLKNLDRFFEECLDELGKYQKELRFIYQMVSSPVYGDQIRQKAAAYNLIYDEYTHKLSDYLSCDEEALRPLVYLFISAILDYVIWDEREKSQLQLDFIYSTLVKQVMHENKNK